MQFRGSLVSFSKFEININSFDLWLLKVEYFAYDWVVGECFWKR